MKNISQNKMENLEEPQVEKLFPSLQEEEGNLARSAVKEEPSSSPTDLLGRREKLLVFIRVQYLQAKPPQQIKELKDLFLFLQRKQSETSMQGVIMVGTTASTEDQLDSKQGGSSIRKSIEATITTATSASSTLASTVSPEEMEGLDDPGSSSSNNKTADCRETGIKEECTGKMGNVSNDEIAMAVIKDLFDVTLRGCDVREEAGEGCKETLEETFLHPPIQYRVAFAKYIIKQIEASCNWSSVPQGSHEKDVEYPIEQESLLEQWYEGLEGLSSSRQVLSEPFYRLYEIKVGHGNKRGGGGRRRRRVRNEEREIVKIFENESSFVADGTTGLVTWKASIEFIKWLESSSDKFQTGEDIEGNVLARRLRDGTENIRWILELGCGSGLLAVAVTKLMPSLEQYIATDGSLVALEQAKVNVEVNSEDDEDKRKLRFERIEWQNEATRESFTQLVDGLATIYGSGQGILLGADIVFDPVIVPDLVELITEFVESRAGKALLSCTLRNEDTLDLLKHQLHCKNLKTNVCGRWEDGEIIEVSLHSQSGF